jgi:hypothetical protein
MIINDRMIIGPLPSPQLKAVLESLLAGGETEAGAGRYIENRVNTEKLVKPKK